MQKEITEVVDVLQNGKIILCPTDTIYGISCDATNETAVEKVFEIKNRPKEKSLILLVSDIEMLKQYVEINAPIERLIASFEVPTTVIYNHPKNIASNAVNENNTIAIRIPNHEFCKKLLKEFGKPIISTSANISGEKTPLIFADISSDITEKVDYIVNEQFDTSSFKQPSKLIKINEDFSFTFLR